MAIMNNLLNFTNFADAMAEVMSLDNKRVKAINDLRKGFEAANKIYEILSIKYGYIQVLCWLLKEEFCKGYYTKEDCELCNLCKEGIDRCNNELNAACNNYAANKVQSELLHFLFGK